ncbi:MAG: hypothetical protein IPH35_18225 [Rhodoferax sp.]|nr:hypothetical protein [Rhodoferax sp.]
MKTDTVSDLEKQGTDEQVESVVPPVAKHGHAQEKGFAASTAQATGMTKQAINRHLARADALGDTTLDKITGTSLDRRSRAREGASCLSKPSM